MSEKQALNAKEWEESEGYVYVGCGGVSKLVGGKWKAFSRHEALEAYAAACTQLQAERIRELEAFNKSLGELCKRVWEAVDPTGEYEGDLRLVEFVKQRISQLELIANDTNTWISSSVEWQKRAGAAERGKDEALALTKQTLDEAKKQGFELVCSGVVNDESFYDFKNVRAESLEQRLVSLQAENEKLSRVIFEAHSQLAYIERQGCPCGARPESLDTHPHVGGCGIERLLRLSSDPELLKRLTNCAGSKYAAGQPLPSPPNSNNDTDGQHQ